ncbi:MAG: hypothetical protein J6W40_02250 [Alphaproteobacteria bacterium]|nr:hypothetical protein [Alphaproteobacteria bacterium]
MAKKKYFTRSAKEYMDHKDLLADDMQEALQKNPDDAKEIRAQFKDASEKLEDLITTREYNAELKRIHNDQRRIEAVLFGGLGYRTKEKEEAIKKSGKRTKLILLGAFLAIQAAAILGNFGAQKLEKRKLEKDNVDKAVVEQRMQKFKADQTWDLLMAAVSEIILLVFVYNGLGWNRDKLEQEIGEIVLWSDQGGDIRQILRRIISNNKMTITKGIGYSGLSSKDFDFGEIDALYDMYMTMKDNHMKDVEKSNRIGDLIAIVFNSLSGLEITDLCDLCLQGKYDEAEKDLQSHILSSPELMEIIDMVASEKGRVNVDLLKKVTRDR